MSVPPDISRLSSKVQLFLLSVLKDKSQDMYLDALRTLKTEIDQRHFPWKASDLESRDVFLSELFVELEEEGGKRQHCVLMLAGLRKVSPQEKYPIASAVLTAWQTMTPPKQAPACPSSLAWAIAVFALASKQVELALAVALCFTGVLRVSEPIRLRRKDVICFPDALVLILAVTKRGIEERVVIRDHTIMSWMRIYLKTHTFVDDQPLLAIGHAKVRYLASEVV